jgi:chromosome partitioning protein
MRIALISTKGGSGKTTSAVHLALALHRTGKTLAVDTDQVTASLTSWNDQQGGSLPFTVTAMTAAGLRKGFPDLAAGYEHAVIDGPPGDLAAIRAAIMAVSVVIVPVSPTGLDLNRLRPTFEVLAEMEPVNPVDVGVLLTKVRRGTRSAREAREVLAELGYPVLDTEIPLAEAYAGSFGTAPDDLGRYADLLDELREPTP